MSSSSIDLICPQRPSASSCNSLADASGYDGLGVTMPIDSSLQFRFGFVGWLLGGFVSCFVSQRVVVAHFSQQRFEGVIQGMIRFSARTLNRHILECGDLSPLSFFRNACSSNLVSSWIGFRHRPLLTIQSGDESPHATEADLNVVVRYNSDLDQNRGLTKCM